MSWFWASVASCVLCVPLVLYLAMSRFFPRRLNLLGAHVLITGGSSGIGLACAKQCVRRGAHVTLVARDMKRLERAREEVKSAAREVDAQHVLILSCDMLSDFDTILASFDRAVHEVGPVDVLINCAGISSSTAFDESSIETFEKLMRLNYLTAVYATRAVLTSMKDRNNGRIVFTSSQAGQLGLYGYTAYSASKFALRGFAEALQMEVKPYNVFITLAFPPDTDTPGTSFRCVIAFLQDTFRSVG
jgi:3-dehydrosphinganine reductase